MPTDWLARELLLPPVIRQNIEREELVAEKMRQAEEVEKIVRHTKNDDRLDIVLINERAPADKHPDIIPGYWHVRRRNVPPAPDSYMPITDEKGGWAEPVAHVILLKLDQRDLQKHGIPDKRIEDDRLNVNSEDLVEEMASDYYAARRVPGENVFKKRMHRKG